MINIQNIPLVHEKDEDAFNFFTPDSNLDFFLKPKWSWLPDFDEMDEEEKGKYKLKNIKEGLYLTGLELILDKWVNMGFCASVFATYGLILDEAYPVEMKKDQYGIEKTMVHIKFKHILFEARYGDGINYTVTL